MSDRNPSDGHRAAYIAFDRFPSAKGSAVQSELEASGAALEALGAVLEDVTSLKIAGLPSQSVVIVRKVAETPERYPRRTGIPTKRPLG